jgi:hypothetical protein
MRFAAVVGLIGFFVQSAAADDGDDTLEFYLAKSQQVVFGEVTAEPFGFSWEGGVVHYSVNFRIIETIRGELVAGKTIQAGIVRFESEDADRLRLSKGSRCVLFLKRQSPGNIPEWSTVDPWFGCLPENSQLRSALKRLEADEKSKPRQAGK